MTEEEIKFLAYWEKQRTRNTGFLVLWKAGLPLGIAIGLGIILNLFTGWYSRATMVLNTNPSIIFVLLLAIILIIFFISFFTARHRWEMNELRYKELKQKEK